MHGTRIAWDEGEGEDGSHNGHGVIIGVASCGTVLVNLVFCFGIHRFLHDEHDGPLNGNE